MPFPTPPAGRVFFLVALPSNLLGTFGATVVAPLRLKTGDDAVTVLHRNPVVHIDNQTCFLRTQELVAILTRSLDTPFAELSAQREEIPAVLDFLFAGIRRRPDSSCRQGSAARFSGGAHLLR